MTSARRTEALGDQHERAPFDCGVPELDEYFRRRARQDRDRLVAAVFVLAGDEPRSVAGFYTLSALSVALADLPVDTARRLPRYPRVPATLLGRLAVDRRYRGRGLGEFLLMDALARSLDQAVQVASSVVVVDAKDEPATAFYERYGFLAFPERRDRLFLPMRTIAKILGP